MNYYKKILTNVGSDAFFRVLLGVFVFQALWIALSGAYSMAFDEYFHYGIIKLYTQQWTPFFASQPVGADAFGAVSRDPSYLYHYIMSFPLRLFAHFFHAFAAQIIFLRVLDIAFIVGGLIMFKTAFRRADLSARVTNIALGFFMFLPVTPFVAAQVNYDDLLFLLSGITLWTALAVSKRIRTDKQLPVVSLMWLATLVSLASLVKYAFLPIALALFVYFVVVIKSSIGFKSKRLRMASGKGLFGAKRWQVVLAIVVMLISVGLFTERYAVNIIRYHTPTPDCDQVISLQYCSAYEPFERNYIFRSGQYELPMGRIITYPYNEWVLGMLRSTYFVLGSKQSGYQAGEPLPLAYDAGYIVLVGGMFLVIARGRWLWSRSHANQMFLIVGGTYIIVLFLQNFFDFLNTHVAVAIQGRYLLPVLPLFLILKAQAATNVLRRHSRIAVSTAVLLAIMTLQGGGLVPFIVRGRDGWLWQAPVVISANHAARDVLRPLILGD